MRRTLICKCKMIRDKGVEEEKGRVRKEERVKWAVGFFVLILVFLVGRQWPDEKLHLVFCDVGQGDAILITYKFNQVLVDGGPDNSVLACLSKNMPFLDRKIELVVLTHPEADHFNGLIDVFQRYRVEKLAANPFGLKNRPQFEKLLKLVFEQKVYTFFPTSGDQIRLGKLQFDILWPSRLKHEELASLKEESLKTTSGFWLIDADLITPNDFSLVLHLSFGQFDALLPGDASFEVTQTLAWRKKLPQVEVLKAPHHGSGQDNTEELYKVAKPTLVVISVGKNRFGHPSPSLIRYLQTHGIRVRRTDRDGKIEVISDGRGWWIAD